MRDSSADICRCKRCSSAAFPSVVFLKKELSNSNSGAAGTEGSDSGAGRILGGMSEGGSTGTVAEGEGAASAVAICASEAWTEGLAGAGEDCARALLAAAVARMSIEQNIRARGRAIGVIGSEAGGWCPDDRFSRASWSSSSRPRPDLK